jgi:hypothetical protein
MSYRTFALLYDVLKLPGLAAAGLCTYESIVRDEPWGPVALSSFAFLLAVGCAFGALYLSVASRVIRLRCPDCGSAMSLDVPHALHQCANCRAAFWKNLVFCGYTRIPDPGE